MPLKDFDTKSDLTKEAEKADFVIFYASVDPSLGKSWCPDCVNAEGPVSSTFDRPDGPEGLIVYVGQRAAWRNSENPYRQSPFKIERLPTIVKVPSGDESLRTRLKNSPRLVEEDVSDEIKLRGFVASLDASENVRGREKC